MKILITKSKIDIEIKPEEILAFQHKDNQFYDALKEVALRINKVASKKLI
jgi:hypothetical protein